MSMPWWFSAKDSCIAEGLGSIPGRATKLPTSRELWPKGNFRTSKVKWFAGPMEKQTEEHRKSDIPRFGTLDSVCTCMPVGVYAHMHTHAQSQPARLLHPWNFSGKNTGARMPFCPSGDLSHLDRLCLLHWQADSLPLTCLGSHGTLDKSLLFPNASICVKWR